MDDRHPLDSERIRETVECARCRRAPHDAADLFQWLARFDPIEGPEEICPGCFTIEEARQAKTA